MKRILRLCFVIALSVSPTICFSWGESKHPISELLIQRVYLDTNYVFCGCDAYWGTNVFGLFIFDRRTETWANYPSVARLGGHYGRVKKIEAEGGFVYVTFFTGHTLRFSRQDGSCDTAGVREYSRRLPEEFQITVKGIHYRVYRDSVIVGNTPYTVASTRSSQLIPPPTGVKPVPKVLNPIFSHPVLYQDKIYMPYDLGLGVTTTWTNGIAVFDISEKTFCFYGSNIFKGTVTDGFVYDSLVIFPTARFIYEANARPAAGFVAFSPADSTFFPWKEFPLPDIPLAIFQVAQDKKEHWMGTDKGVFRIDKKTRKATHYQITKGIVSKDSANVHYSCGNFEENSSAVATLLSKDEKLELVGVLNGWCEIEGLVDTTGWVEPEYVEDVILQEDADGHTTTLLVFKMRGIIPIKVSDAPDPLCVSKGHQYEVVGKSGKAGQATCYKIRLSKAWINMDDLIFHLGEVK